MTHFKETLPNEFAWAAECNMATLDDLLSRKRSSRSSIKRQAGICLRMIVMLNHHYDEIQWTSGLRGNFGRVHDLILAIRASSPEKAMEDYVTRIQSIYR